MMMMTTIHDVMMVLVRLNGPKDSIVSAFIAMWGVGPRRKTKPRRARISLVQHFHQEQVAA
jgi:hypothetical protein